MKFNHRYADKSKGQLANTFMLFAFFLLGFNTSISFSQQIFTESGQRLGNAASWTVSLCDLDGDGDLDAVLANNFWNTIIPQVNEIWLNDGHGIFTKSSQILGSSGKVTLNDIDHDGDLDMVENGDWQTAVINCRLNDGHGNFLLSSKFSFRGNIIIFNNKFSSEDSNEVITFETGTNTILRIYSLTNDSSVIKKTITLNNFSAAALDAGDLNNDGYSDLVIGQGGGPTLIMLSDKNNGFTTSDQRLGNYICSNLYLGDLNGDGSPDLLQCNYHTMPEGIVQPAQLYLNDGTGKFNIAPLPYNTTYLTQAAAIKDLDNDGDLDIYINHNHRYQDWDRRSEILLNDGHANFTAVTVNMDLIQADGIDFGDLDNDGDLDAFLAVTKIIDDNHYGGPSRVWFNTTITNPSGIEEKKNDGLINYNLFQNYPNPFNPETTIKYLLKQSSTVKLTVYNLLGQKIKTLVDSFQNEGEQSVIWNGTDDSNNSACSGIYLCRLESGKINFIKKMALLR